MVSQLPRACPIGPLRYRNSTPPPSFCKSCLRMLRLGAFLEPVRTPTSPVGHIDFGISGVEAHMRSCARPNRVHRSVGDCLSRSDSICRATHNSSVCPWAIVFQHTWYGSFLAFFGDVWPGADKMWLR